MSAVQPTFDVTSRDELARSLDRLGAGFTALSGLLLAAPSEQVLSQVRDPGLLAEWPSLEGAHSLRGVSLLTESLALGETEAFIRADHTQLFVGPGPITAPPYESVHRSQERLTFERETFMVREAYSEFGLAAPRLNKEPDDHIGLELSFVGTLCVRGLDALDSNDDGGLAHLLDGVWNFLDQHLFQWGPTCFEQIGTSARSRFYEGVAELGHGLLADARVTLGA